MKHTSEIIMQRAQRFVAGTLRDALGYRQKKFTLEATDLGFHSSVFFLTFENGPPLVVKVLTSNKRFRSLVQCAEHLMKLDVRVPQILYAYEDRNIFPWLRMHIICEERIIGTTLFEMQRTAALIPELTRFFVRLHSITRETWGEVAKPQKNGLFEYFIAKAQRKLHLWRHYDPSVSTAFEKKCTDWMKEQKKTIQNIATFSLSHGDPNPGNIIYNSKGDIVLLDTGHIRYFPRALDYYKLLIHFCQDNKELIKQFEGHYLNALTKEEQNTFDDSHLFFKLSVLIDFGENLAKRLIDTRQDHPWHAEFVANLGKIKQAVEEIIRS